MRKDELDVMLAVVENPVRRKIIKRLSQEPAYALQLSKELGLGQPLVAKHLRAMENAGLVRTVVETSPNGPARKRYSLARSVSITMDVGPNLFIERGTAIEKSTARAGHSEAANKLRRRVTEAADSIDDGRKLSALSRVLSDTDDMIAEIENERRELLAVRNLAMYEASMATSRFQELDTRRVLFHILDAHEREVDRISEALNIREFSVRSILGELQKYFE